VRILICSHVFAPSIGGIETVTAILAEQFSRMGATVTVATQTPGEHGSGQYEVVRQPTTSKLLSLAWHADIVFQSNISLRSLLPILPLRKPIVITHHVQIGRGDGRLGWQDRAKRGLLRTCQSISISKSIADSLPVKSVVIGNPFEAGEFLISEDGSRERELVFLGRLVSVKGCDVALRALGQLKAEGLRPSFTVIGDGPEMPVLKRLSQELGVAEQVDFRGAMREGRGRELARHRIMVVPSIYAEPFGVVALEGLAAGCVVAASRTGGLAEAVGPCGLLHSNGDATALAADLRRLLTEQGLRAKLLAGRDAHLQQFQPETVARRYLEIFESAIRN
jgi:glycogen synthase